MASSNISLMSSIFSFPFMILLSSPMIDICIWRKEKLDDEGSNIFAIFFHFEAGNSHKANLISNEAIDDRNFL